MTTPKDGNHVHHRASDPGPHKITASTFLQWFVPAALSVLIGLAWMINTRVGNVANMLDDLDTRVTAIESSRFTTTDGLEMWRAIDSRVTREELNGRLVRIEEILDVIRVKIGD